MFRHFEGAMRLNFIRPFLAKCSVRIVSVSTFIHQHSSSKSNSVH